MLKNLSPQNRASLRRLLSKVAIASVLLCTFAVSASAYTLVFRNGQRLEIPSEFTLTTTTLTYEISPGFQKTLQLILIDVPATERANKESPGAFFKRREAAAPVVAEPAPQASRTLTNSDLAAIRQRRIESEKTYEARRKQLGLPSVAETRMRQEAEGAILRQQLREQSSAKAREESYWRGRARELRNEIATVDTQIGYLRGRISELTESSPVTESWTSTYPIWPDYRSGSRNGRWGSRRGRRQEPPVFGPSPQYPYGYPGSQYPYGYPGSQNPYGYPGSQYPYGYPGSQYPYGYPNQYPNQYPGGPFDNFEKSSQRTDLTHRLDELLVRRAGLAAEWRVLEDEARDARVPQIWLEP